MQAEDHLRHVRTQGELHTPTPRRTIKLLMDYGIILAGAGLALPLLTLVVALCALLSGRPIFYRSKRIGKGGRIFHAWKFRTMAPNAEGDLEQHLAHDEALRREWEANTKLKYDPRVTDFGQWLRRTGLDELPQLWNVLRRDMSLVGPRPLLAEDQAKYGDAFEIYASVLPGITGPWQVSGRNSTTYEDRIRLDCEYATSWSPLQDVALLFRTIPVVLRANEGY